ncbi:uncharacterized protein LOC123686362 [Harmonia axyridis]|uniref:uncharacterized protein LOC123686362 n=1 Tax=Harmonia axyridis TaxID=115357 RepID=UPI001E275E47|nr:uncharacterized protein LOC123686362 [Harmonia axyridis]
MGLRISCLWVPSHSQIRGNEMADKLANEGRLMPNPQRLRAGPSELWPTYKKELKALWCRYFKEVSENKGINYAQKLNCRPYITEHWFRRFERPRKYISTLCRMRSGHCSSPPHLYRLRILDSPLCS